jgi:uncharacterized protein YndB with AHSA1/START domain
MRHATVLCTTIHTYIHKPRARRNGKEAAWIERYRQLRSARFTPELLKQWWAPKSFGMTFISCEADVRTGGTYRFVFGHPASEQPMAFFGRYIDVTPHARLVWTNDEGCEGGAVTTVTFEERGGETLVVFRDLYPSKDALDGAIASGATGGFGESFAQPDSLLVTLDARAGRS